MLYLSKLYFCKKKELNTSYVMDVGTPDDCTHLVTYAQYLQRHGFHHLSTTTARTTMKDSDCFHCKL